MSRARFEPAISTFERPKTVLGSDRSAIEIGCKIYMLPESYFNPDQKQQTTV
jgi:hypothetical protein